MHYTWQVPKIRRFVGLRLPSQVFLNGKGRGTGGVCCSSWCTGKRIGVPSAKDQNQNSEISKSSPKPRRSVPAVLFSLKNHPGNCSQMGNLNWARGALIRRRAEIKAPCLCFLRKHSNCHATAAGAVDEEGDLKKVHGASPTPTGHIPGGTPPKTAVFVLDPNKAAPSLRHSAPKLHVRC